MNEHEKPICVLGIDGGGITGMSTGLFLSEVEKRVGKRIDSVFDVIGGTSTGTIMAAGYALPGENGQSLYPASRIIDFYEHAAPDVFSRSRLHILKTLGGVIGPKYPKDGVERGLQKFFGDCMLSQLMTTVVATSYNLATRKPYILSSHEAKMDPTKDMPLWKAIRASTASPSFLPSASLELPLTKQEVPMADGALIADNPSMYSLLEAIKLFPKREYVVLSLGVKRPFVGPDHLTPKTWGIFHFLKAGFLDMMVQGAINTASDQVERLLKALSANNRYYRVEIDVNGFITGDDVRPENLLRLTTLTKKHISNMESKFDDIISCLKR